MSFDSVRQTQLSFQAPKSYFMGADAFDKLTVEVVYRFWAGPHTKN